jgi:hypothetical protein
MTSSLTTTSEYAAQRVLAAVRAPIIRLRRINGSTCHACTGKHALVWGARSVSYALSEGNQQIWLHAATLDFALVMGS